MMGRLSFLIVALASLAGCSGTSSQKSQNPSFDISRPQSEQRIRLDTTALAQDNLEGRETGTEGYLQAVDYVVEQFESIGLVPMGQNGFLQEISLHRERADLESFVLELDGQNLTPFDDFIVLSNTYYPNADAMGEVVFMGHGIDAPMFGYDAFERYDVSGKIVAILQGVPRDLPQEVRAHYSRPQALLETAKKHGAVGILVLTPRGGPPPGQIRRFAGRTQLTVAVPGGDARVVEGVAMLTANGTSRLIAAAGIEVSDLTPDSVGMNLGVNVRIAGRTVSEVYQEPNVIGMIQGSDPALKDEFVVLTAHLDHIGKLDVVENDPGRDVINNGAMDNAIGVATLLEEARKIVSGPLPRRSILFVALAAEEPGLLGSEYFARNATVPKGSIVANINLDMPILFHDFTDVIAVGAEHSSLGDLIEQTLEPMDISVSPDPNPEEVLFIRADHYSFVKAGIPSVYLILGYENGGLEASSKFLTTHYHRPSDQTDLPIRWDQAAKFTEVNYRIVSAIANADDRPTWNEESFFGQQFGK